MDDIWQEKAKAEAILAREQHKRPVLGKKYDHDIPDMKHPDQSGDDNEAKRRGLKIPPAGAVRKGKHWHDPGEEPDEEHGRAHSRYRPAFLKQLDGSTCGGANCNVCTHRMEADAAERGINPRKTSAPWLPAASRWRNRVNSLNGKTGCGGTNNAMNGKVNLTDYGQPLLNRFDVPFADVYSLIRSGRIAELTIQYSALRGTPFDSFPSFSGRHAVAGADVDSTTILIAEPGADGRWLYTLGRYAKKGWQRWPLALFQKAAKAAAGGASVVDACDFTWDIEPGVKLAGAGVNLRSAPTTTAAIVGKSQSDGIHRGSVIVAPLSASFALLGWVTGAKVSGVDQWGKLRFLHQTVYVHKPLLVVV